MGLKNLVIQVPELISDAGPDYRPTGRILYKKCEISPFARISEGFHQAIVYKLSIVMKVLQTIKPGIT